MTRRAAWRLADIKQSIDDIRALLKDSSFEDLLVDRAQRAAFERFLEILSEASRGLPDEWKQDFGPDLPWRQIADLGNHIRHAYHRIDAELLWRVYVDDLPAVEAVIDRLLAVHGPEHGG